MVILNAVECTNTEPLRSIVVDYTLGGMHPVYTDSLDLHSYMTGRFGKDSVKYNDSLVALWLRIVPNAILVITDINNIISSVFDDIKEKYTVISIDDVGGRGE